MENSTENLNTEDLLTEDVVVPEILWNSESRSINWVAALEYLKTQTGLIEDKDFASYLEVPTSNLSDMKRGRTELSPRIKCQILSHLGFHTMASAVYFLLNDEKAAMMKRAMQRQAKKIATKHSS